MKNTCLYIIFVVTLLRIRGDNDTFDSCVEPFIRFVQLTEEYCGGVDWCFIKTPQKTSEVIDVSTGCCKRCSCSKHCSHSNSCCPDFELRDSLNGQMFVNVSEAVSVLRNNVSCTDDALFSDRHTNRIAEDNENRKCSYSSLKPPDPVRVKSSMYFMVTSCTNETVDVEIRSKCESTYSSLSNGYPIQFVPVQSLKTGVVYRNKFCYDCSIEETGNYAKWDMMIASYVRPQNILYDVLPSFPEILHYITSIRDVDLLFEPTNYLKRMKPPKACTIVDVKTCPSENGTFDDMFTDTACQRYSLPVYSVGDGIVKAFNNIACVNCNNVLTQCTYFYRWEQRARPFVPFLGKLALSVDSYGYQTNDIDQKTSNDKLKKIFSTICGHGYVYDKDLDECRKVYCPCGMMIHNSSCVFIFGEVISQFTIVTSIDVNVQHPADIDQYLFDYLYHSINASSIFHPMRIELFQSDSSDRDYAAIFTLCRRYSPIMFSDVVSEALRLFKRDFTFGLKSQETRAKISIDDTLYDSGKYTLSDPNKRIKFNRIHLFEHANNSKSFTRDSTVQITECNFCYRLEVKQSESQPLKSRFLVLKRTQTLLPHTSVNSMFFNISRMVLCASRVLGTETNQGTVDDSVFSKSADVVVESTASNENNEGEYRIYIVTLPATVAGTFLVVCLLRSICKRLMPTADNREPDVQLSTISGSNMQQ